VSRAKAALAALPFGAAAVAVAAWYGCSIYDPSLLLPGASEGGPEAAPPVEAGVDAAPPEAAPPSCPEVFPPAKPSADDPSDAGSQAFVAALHTLDLGISTDGGAPPLFGYDLDQVYTCCDGGAPSCTPPVVATHCDEVGGRDNSGGELIANLALLDPAQFNSNTISQRLETGVYSIILQISDYNGQANDTQVVAALYGSDGLEADPEAAPPTAKWDGTDVWTIDESFVLDGIDASPILPNHYDAHAYVSGGTLVMQVNFPLSLGTSGTGNITISLSGGVLSAQIEPVAGGGYKLGSGQVSGRWTASSVLTAAQGLTLGGSTICPGSSLYTNIKQQICAAADIMTDPTKDNKGATCDALSVAFGFTADPAVMGAVVPSPVRTGNCGDAGLPNDDCTTP
jgi:hypothetical protein